MSRPTIRFEVFKRDGFKCQYCGRTPPAVILEIDHINPRAEGGRDCIENYITACFDCNRGKGKRKLDSLPVALGDTIETIKERRRQLQAFNRLIETIEKEYQVGIDKVNQAFQETFPDRILTDNFGRTSIKTFLKLLPPTRVLEAMSLACSKHGNDPERTVSYFCGICWNWIKRPETRGW